MKRKFILVSERVCNAAVAAIRTAPIGYEVEIREPKRNLDQNAAFWALMTELSTHVPFAGERRSPEDWRTLVLSGWLKATGRPVTVLQGLEGEPVALGLHSSERRKAEMSEVLDYATAFLANKQAEAA